MRPLHAIIITANKKTGLKLRTESGLVVVLDYDKKYHIGESVLISYDFTKNKVVGILEHKEEYMHEIKEEKLDHAVYKDLCLRADKVII